MTRDSVAVMAIVLVGVTSLYLLLALFQRLLPTSMASEVRKLRNVTKSQPLPRQAEMPDAHQLHVLPSDLGGRRGRRSAGTLSRKLRYGGWTISPLVFHMLSVVISLGVAASLSAVAAPFIVAFSLLAGPLIMRLSLRQSVEFRSKRFSQDYPQFLMTVVSLLKTGMTPTGALEAAARGLEPGSLVRKEILLMIERVRVGMSEERSIGVFAEDIEHPEIELFVQSLLLGLRMGGSLADSLERLSRQVRKRQHFKSSAVASVAQQRGSIIAIAIIMGGLAVFVAVAMPRLIAGLCGHPTGWIVVQVCVVAVVVAILWFQNITRIKI